MKKLNKNDRSLSFIVVALILYAISQPVVAQDSSRPRNTFVSVGYLQIKESPNYGLVFRGPSIDFGMNWNFSHGSNTWYYEYKLGAAFPFSKGIAGLIVNLKPIEMAYTFKLPVKKFGLKLGPALKMEYNIESYPDLQSGYYFWITNYNLGLSVLADLKIKNAIFRLRFLNSVAGFISRGDIYDDPYFFTAEFSEVMSDIHSNFTFATFGDFNNTFLELRYQKSSASRLAYAYVLDYFVYTKNPQIKYLNQTVRLIFIPKVKNEK
jgi:hypothetical protein